MLKCDVIDSISKVPAAHWDRMFDSGNPFLSHACLNAFEDSGCVTADTGWQPAHLLVQDEGELVGAMPLYEKTHSWGEYVFD